MSKNMASIILEEVSKTNKNRYNITKEVLKEDSYKLDPRFDRANSFYGKATIDDNGDEITLISYNTPIVKVSNGNFEFLCGEDDLTQTTMRHIRDFLKQMDYDGKIELSGKDYPITRKWVIDHLNKIEEAVTIEGQDTDNNDTLTPEEAGRISDNIASDKREEVKEKIEDIKNKLADETLTDEEKKALEDEIKSLETMLESVVLTEAPEDEEFEVSEEVIDEPIEDEEDTTDEEMTDEEVQEEVIEDEEDTIEDAVEQPFYATIPEFDELRDVLVDLDYRLFLINDNMVCIGRLNGPDIEFLTSNRPENTEIEVSEQNDKAEEIETKAEEDGEQAFEYKWIKAPDTFDKFLSQVNVVYLSPDMSEEDKEQYAGIEASHESVMNYLMNELPEDKKEELENEVEDTEMEEVPEEISEEPIENETEEEIDVEELPEDEEEEEK